MPAAIPLYPQYHSPSAEMQAQPTPLPCKRTRPDISPTQRNPSALWRINTYVKVGTDSHPKVEGITRARVARSFAQATYVNTVRAPLSDKVVHEAFYGDCRAHFFHRTGHLGHRGIFGLSHRQTEPHQQRN